MRNFDKNNMRPLLDSDLKPTDAPASAPMPENAPTSLSLDATSPDNTQSPPQKSDSGSSGTLGNVPAADLQKYLDNLSDPQKTLVTSYLTPEIALLLGVFLGPDSFQFLAQYADPTKVLMPQPRAEVEKAMGASNASQPGSSSGASQAMPAMAPMQPQGGAPAAMQPPSAPPMQGPSQGLLAHA
jgi:hypothetical protein